MAQGVSISLLTDDEIRHLPYRSRMSSTISIPPNWTRLNGSRLVSSTGVASDWCARISVWKRSWVCGREDIANKNRF